MVESDPRELEYIKAFAQGVAELGWAVGRNVRIEYRWGAGDLDCFRSH
jgi:putative tryptophan/tyrosine transport system substrate-binding protein